MQMACHPDYIALNKKNISYNDRQQSFFDIARKAWDEVYGILDNTTIMTYEKTSRKYITEFSKKINRRQHIFNNETYEFYGARPDGSCGFHCSGLNTFTLIPGTSDQRSLEKIRETCFDISNIINANAENKDLQEFLSNYTFWKKTELKDSLNENCGKHFTPDVKDFDVLKTEEEKKIIDHLKSSAKLSPYNNAWFAYNGLKEQIVSYLLNVKFRNFIFVGDEKTLAEQLFYKDSQGEENDEEAFWKKHSSIQKRTPFFIVVSSGAIHDSILTKASVDTLQDIVFHVRALREERMQLNDLQLTEYHDTGKFDLTNYKTNYNKYITSWSKKYR
jgi:hypothetical protein